MMSARRRRPFALLRWLIAARALGERRQEIERDLDELFHRRASARGRVVAHARYLADVISLWTRPIQKIEPVIGATRPSFGSGMARDVVYAARVLRARPGSALVAVLGLAVAIGIGTSVFAVLNAVAFRPLGVPDPASVVRVYKTSRSSVSTSWPYREALALRERSPQVPQAITIDSESVEFATEAGAERPLRTRPRFVSGSYMQMLGAHAAMGRLLEPKDDERDAPPVMVISHRFWTQNLAGDRSVIGRTVWLNGVPFAIVGVTPRDFSDTVDRPPMYWATLTAYTQLTRGQERFDRDSTRGVDIVARVPAAMSSESAQAMLSAGAAAVANVYFGASAPAGSGVGIERVDDRLTGPRAAAAFTAIAVVLTVIGLILLLACANVTHLLLATAAARHREIGMRLALGATRGRVLRQLLTESVLLGLAGGGLGLLVAMWGLPVLKVMVRVPTDLDTTFDWRVYLFLTIISMLAGVGAGLAPARHGARGDVLAALKSDTAAGRPASSRRSRNILIGAQAAASVVLLVLALLLTRATVNASRVDLGFDADGLVVVSAGFHGYDESRMTAFWDAALRSVRALPGVESAALVTYPPLGDGAMVTSMTRGSRRYTVFYNHVSAEYFSTLQLPVIRGRAFTAEEARNKVPVVVISEAVAREFWPGEDPVGRPCDRICDDNPPPTIVGIVKGVVTMRLNDPDKAAIYIPIATDPGARLIVRTRPAAQGVTQALQTALRASDPELRPTAVLVADNVARQLSEPRALASLAGTVGIIALALSLVGIYGVSAFLVGQRTVEIGVRMAIGATLRDVLTMLVRDTLRPVVIGLGLGMVLAVLAGQLFASNLFGVRAYDPLALSAAAALLLATATLAVIIPARRAARVDPASVLRS